MGVIVYGGGNISSGTLPASEGVIASIAANPQSAKVRLRGHVVCTGNVSAGLITLRIRQGSVTGSIVYTCSVTVTATQQVSIPFETEDDSGWITQANAVTNGTYVLTAVDNTGTGSVSGGSFYLESIP